MRNSNNERLVTNYLNWCDNEKGLSDNTIIAYKSHLNMFMKYCDLNFTDLTTNKLREILNVISKENSKKTRNYVHSVLKNFFNYLIDIEELIRVNSIIKIPKTKEEQKERRSLSTSQINDILQQIKKNGYYRDEVLFKFMIQTGLRVSEVVNLENEDVDISSGFIRVKNGKGNKERYVPIVNTLKDDLIKYNDYKKDNNIKSFNYFYNLKDTSKGITRENILHLLKKYASYADINPDIISPHVCRHTFATLMLYKGCDIYVVSKVMGHNSINTTMIYLTNNKYRNKEIMEKFNIFD